MSETAWWQPPTQQLHYMRVYFGPNMWVQWAIKDPADFVNGVNTIRSQGMLITPTAYIPERIIWFMALIKPDGKSFATDSVSGPMVDPPPPNAPTTETPQ